MATIISAQSGNFLNSSTWIGGSVPGELDDVVADTGHIVTIDSSVSVTSVSQIGTGKFILSGSSELTGNIMIGSGTFPSGGTVEVTSVAGQTAIINGNISGVSSTLRNQAGVVFSGNGSLVINGDVAGTPGNLSAIDDYNSVISAAVYSNTGNSVTINGNISGGDSNKVGLFLSYNANFATVAINGSVQNETTARDRAVQILANNVSIVIVGNVSAGRGTTGAIQSIGKNLTLSVTGNLETKYGGTVVAARLGNITVTGDLLAINGTCISLREELLFRTETSFFANSGCALSTNESIINVVGNLYSIGSGSSSCISVSCYNTTLNVTGNVTSTETYCIYSDSSSKLNCTIVGNIRGAVTGTNNIGKGLYLGTQNISVKVIGNVTAGTVSGAEGISITGTNSVAFLEVIGDVTAVGDTHGIINGALLPGGVMVSGSMIDSPTGTAAVYSPYIYVRSNVNSTTRFANAANYPNGGYVSFVSPDLVTGMPSTEDVRAGVLYGFNNELVGSMAIPVPNSVLVNEPVDDTVGTALLSASHIADLVATHVAVARRSPPAV